MFLRNLIFFLSASLIFSCKKEKKEDPAPNVQHFPVELRKTVSYDPAVIISTYKYDASNNIIRENVTSDGKLTDYYVFSYNAAGKLQKREHYDAGNVLTEQDEYVFNSTNQPTRLNHSMFHQPGVAVFHHYMAYSYSPDGTLKQFAEIWPASRTQLTADQERYSYTYQINNASGQKALYDNKITPADSYHEEIELDGKLNPFAATGINPTPTKGNITRRTKKDLAGNILNTVQYSITYNDAGYPVTITEMHTDGTIKTEAYSYKVF